MNDRQKYRCRWQDEIAAKLETLEENHQAHRMKKKKTKADKEIENDRAEC